MSQAGNEVWRLQIGASNGYDYAYAVSADAEGSFFLAGNTDGTFGGFNEGDYDVVVAKIDGDGSLVWSWQEGSDDFDILYCAAATGDGGVVVGGRTSGNYSNVLSEGNEDFVAIKLNSDGDVEWRWQDGTAEVDTIQGCSVTTDGNVVLVGYTDGNWYGTSPGPSSIIALKLDVDTGYVVWRYQEGVDDYFVSGWAVGARSDGSVVLGGRTQGEWDGELTGTTDFIAVALDEDGAELWRWQGGPTSGDNKITGIAILSDDSTVLVGYTEGSYFRDNEGGRDFVVIKLTPVYGNLDWGWQGGTAFDDEFEGVATDISGFSVIMGGYTYGSWAGINDAEEEEMDFAAMSMDAGGDVLWKYQSGTLFSNDFNAVAVRPDGAVLLAGWTYDEFDTSASTNYHTDIAGVLIKTDSRESPTASPTSSPTTPFVQPSTSTTLQPFVSSPSSCGATESFRITFGDIPEIEGCFQATSETFSDQGSTLEVWTTGGDLFSEQVAVIGFADDGTGEYSLFSYIIAFVSDNEDYTDVFCYSEEDAITIHPTDATWRCTLDGTNYIATSDGSFGIDCSCGTTIPAPSGSDSGTPLGVVIGSSVGAAVFLAVAGFFLYKHRTRTRNLIPPPASAVTYPVPPPASAVSYPVVQGGGAAAGSAAPAKGVYNSEPLPPPPPPAYAEELPPYSQ